MTLELSAAAVKRLKRTFTTILGKKSGNPILNNLILQPTGTGVEVTATNLDEWLTLRLPGELSRPTLFPWDDFKSLAARVGAKSSVTLIAGRQEVGVEIHSNGMPVSYRIKTDDPAEFPECPTMEVLETIEYPGSDFATAMARTIKAASTDVHRYVLQSVLLDAAEDRLVGTDGRRLVCSGLPRSDATMQAIIPSTAFLRRGYLKSDVTIELDDEQVRLIADDMTYQIKQIDGSFPRWSEVVPEDKALPVRVDLCDDRKLNGEVLSSLPKTDQVFLYADDRQTVLVSSDGHDGYTHGVLPYGRCRDAGDDVLVGFNPAFIRDVIDGGFNSIGIRDERSPVKFTAKDGAYAILMPMHGADTKPVRDYLDKILRDLQKGPHRVPPQPLPAPTKTPKPQEVQPVPQSQVPPSTEDADPLDQLLAQLANTRAELQEITRTLRGMQSLAKDVDRARRKELREHRVVVDVVSRLKSIAA